MRYYYIINNIYIHFTTLLMEYLLLFYCFKLLSSINHTISKFNYNLYGTKKSYELCNLMLFDMSILNK